MSYLLTSATGVKDLLGKIRDFAVLDGWTAAYDDVVANGRLQLSKGVCKCAFETLTNTHNDLVNGGTVNDSYIRGALCEAFVGGNVRYYGHTGSIVTVNGDADTVDTNDLYGPLTNVWLFSNAGKTNVHVVIQSSADRYSHMSFGILEDHGLTQPDVAYLVGTDYTWWPDNADFSNTSLSACAFNFPGSDEHDIGFFGENSINIRVPDTLLDVALGFTAGNLFVSDGFIRNSHNRGDEASDAYAGATGFWLDYFLGIFNDITTGGAPLSSLPVFYIDSDHVYLGDYPDVRLVSVNNLSPAQEITLASDTWVVFPLKQKGERDDANYGSNPQPVCNSINYGFAYKKTV